MLSRSLAFALLLATSLHGQPQRLAKELQSGWDRWLTQDVAWIITGEEKKAFTELGTDDEREQFVEQFWLRRDPTPDTVENEYKEEHYRRLAYANEHFASGIPGWKTDRGRMYIRFGPPDEIEAHPSGGTYQRTQQEGGGTTSTFPFERWRYRHLDNVGDDVVLEFIDQTMSGEYHLEFDPCRKDALQYVPGAGPTDAESMGIANRTARFQNTNGTTCGPPIGGVSNFDEFKQLDLMANVERAPAVKFKDLEAVIRSDIRYNTLPMSVRVDYLRVTDFSSLANITIEFENRHLAFALKDGMQKAQVNVLGRVYTMTRRPVSTFEKPLAITAPAALLEKYAQQRSVYQESLPLAPGRYKLTLVAEDLVSGGRNTYEVALNVPRYGDGLATSSLVVADKIEKLPMQNIGREMFAIGDWKVRPRASGAFTKDETLWFYLQIYHSAKGRLSYSVTAPGASSPILEAGEELPHSSSQTAIQKMIPLDTLTPGDYILRVNIVDGDLAVQREALFTVK